MGFDALTTIEISQADVQVLSGRVYVIDQQTITALEINLQKEQQDDPTTISVPRHVRKLDEISNYPNAHKLNIHIAQIPNIKEFLVSDIQ